MATSKIGFHSQLYFNRFKEPARNIRYPNSFIIRVLMLRTRKKDFRICVTYLEQWPHLSFESCLTRYIITYLYVDFLTSFHGHEIYLFLIKFADIHIISSTQQLDKYYILQHTPPVQITFAELSKSYSGIDKIIFVQRSQICLASDIIPFCLIKYKGVAKIFYIISDRLMVRFITICRQRVAYIPGRGYIADIVH